MRVDAYRDLANGRWYVQTSSASLRNGCSVCFHNHPKSTNASSHAVLRRMDLTPEIVREIITDAEVCIRPAQTLARLKKKNEDLALRTQDIINTRSRVQAERVGAMTRTRYLVSALDEKGHVHDTQVDEEDRLTHIFFANQEVLKVYSESPDLVLMDCTYKTNKFGMPMLNMIVVSGMNTTTHLAQAFLRGGTIADYVWVLTVFKKTLVSNSICLPNVIFVDRGLALLSALETVLPDVPVLLCLWHGIKAVETHSRKTFQRVIDETATKKQGRQVMIDSADHRQFCDKFLELVRATTEADYEQKHVELAALSEKEAAYIDATWLDKWKSMSTRFTRYIVPL